jgi:ubiquinone/menaquinone biosynthesis C-methylase UbiE
MQRLRLLPRTISFRFEKDDPMPLYSYPVLGKLYRERVELCLNALLPGERILEVGYGSGTSFLNLADLFKEIHGIDLHTHARSVTEAFQQYGLTTQLCTGSLLNLPYPDRTFDAVMCISILEHLRPNDQAQAMSEVRRVLRPGGRFVYGVPVERPLMQRGFNLLGYDIRQFHFSTEQDVAMAADQVFRRVEILRYTPFGNVVGKLYEVGVYERAND